MVVLRSRCVDELSKIQVPTKSEGKSTIYCMRFQCFMLSCFFIAPIYLLWGSQMFLTTLQGRNKLRVGRCTNKHKTFWRLSFLRRSDFLNLQDYYFLKNNLKIGEENVQKALKDLPLGPHFWRRFWTFPDHFVESKHALSCKIDLSV